MPGKKPAVEKVRPSPTQSATLFAPGTKKRGNDGRTYVVAVTKAGVRRWQHVASSAAAPQASVKKTVYVVDNGGTPFLVDLTSLGGAGSAHVWVERRPDLVPGDDGYVPRGHPAFRDMYRPWRTIKYRRAFVGYDPEERRPPGLLDRMLHGKQGVWWHGGNSVLLQVAARRYVYVGKRVYAFAVPADDEIQGYVSPMGNSAVPYPYAVGKRNTYLMIEHTWVPNADLPADVDDPYLYYYNHDLATGREFSTLATASKAHKAHVATHKLRGFKELHERLN